MRGAAHLVAEKLVEGGTETRVQAVDLIPLPVRFIQLASFRSWSRRRFSAFCLIERAAETIARRFA